jgi:hypothetical protein
MANTVDVKIKFNLCRGGKNPLRASMAGPIANDPKNHCAIRNVNSKASYVKIQWSPVVGHQIRSEEPSINHTPFFDGQAALETKR